ncbi:hypothetical protein JKP88DRAFT_339046 [Tribonema minus]|uniref:Acylphosphatase-like domain-containing protein n=1 Tax=Tribonema minus TaxID=303371 RepID=A0A835YGY7_9STRA|nr:hypothetical protein JKP88DRAFT_339046 [Tribonema minus]
MAVLLLLPAVRPDAEVNVPRGWRKSDRFYGFRYEVRGLVQDVGFLQAAVHAAEELGCFGWIQNSKVNTVVGEARCSKLDGPKMVEFLRFGPDDARVTEVLVKPYEDTKIKLHFASFLALPDERKTCFRQVLK